MQLKHTAWFQEMFEEPEKRVQKAIIVLNFVCFDSKHTNTLMLPIFF